MDAQIIFAWSLKVSLFLVLIYGAYWILFKNNTRFQFRRTLLLFSLALAIATPFIEIEVPLGQIYQLDKEQVLAQLGTEIEGVEIKPTNDPAEALEFATTRPPITWISVVVLIYLIGLTVSFSMMLIEGLRLANWYYMGARRTDIQDNVITHRGIKYPFSFWKWIFVPQGTDYDKEIWEIIEKHESTHLRQGHSFDMVFSSLVQCLLWYNPIVYLFQKELKDNHEALADQCVLEFTDLKTYAKALLSVSVNANAMKLGHSFALVSTFSKRLKAMKQEQTRFSKTISSALLLAFIITIVTAFNVVNAQETEEDARNTVGEMIFNGSWSFLVQRKLTSKHIRILEKLKADNPGKDISFGYLKAGKYQEYLESYQPDQKTLFIDQLTTEEHDELYKSFEQDTARHVFRIKSSKESDYSFNYMDFPEKLRSSVTLGSKYVIMYERIPMEKDINASHIYEVHEVDKLPEPLGGLINLEKAIALDADIPDDIDKTLLPKTIDFEFIVHGGNKVSGMSLLTELEGDEKEIDKIYKFMGQLHNSLLGKIRAHYPWKRGIKDGKEVWVRMKIAIPTRYM